MEHDTSTSPHLHQMSSHATLEAVAVRDSPLFTLSPELRNAIYEYAVSEQNRATITAQGGIPEPTLLLTCKAIRREAIGMFYRHDNLRIQIGSYSPTVCQLWRRKGHDLHQQYGIEISKPFTIRSGPRNWDNLMSWLKLRHVNQIGGLASKPLGSHDYREEDHFIQGMMEIVFELGDRPWERVEGMLHMLRLGLIKFHQQWAV